MLDFNKWDKYLLPPSIPSPSSFLGHLICVRHFLPGVFLFAAGLFAESFQPADVKIMGDLRYGQTSPAVDCSSASPFYAFVFNGKANERVDIVVKSPDRQAFVALADPSLEQITSGTGHLTFTLPNRGPDAEAYYIVFRDSESKDGKFTVELNKLPPDGSQ